jgi:hypothetical protein
MSNYLYARFCPDYRRGRSEIGAGGVNAGASNRPRQNDFAKQYICVPNQQNAQYFRRSCEGGMARYGADYDVGKRHSNGGNSHLDREREKWRVGAKSIVRRNCEWLSVMRLPGARNNKKCST